MIDWVKRMFSASPPSAGSASSTVANPELLSMLREEMKECEALYRASGHLCAQVCPEKIGADRDKFSQLMLDLHRGLLIKVLIEIAHRDRSWHPAEKEVALVLLQHVWGVNVSQQNLIQALQNVAAHAEMLKWSDLLRPFIELPPLVEQLGDLGVSSLRIANLIAKADGRVSAVEAQGLKTVQTVFERALRARNARQDKQRPRASRVEINQGLVDLVHPRMAMEERVRANAQEQLDGSNNRDSEKEPLSAAQREQMLDQAMRELDQLIGLELVKKDIRELVSFLKIQKERKRHNLPATTVSLHSVFQGNPGTGKTTVARILGHIFCGLEFSDRGHTIETDRSGLVAQYVGQSGPKTHRRVDEALGGVLFVDEAYSLVAERGDDPFGHEASQVLLKRMEDDRQRLIVILAGYPKPMQRMLRSNPGLSSRFQRTFDFPDYTPKELLRIFYRMCRKHHYQLPKGTRIKLLSGFQYLIDCKDEHFGNARLARNVFEHAIRNMASRIVNIAPLTREILTTLQPEDIEMRGVPTA